MSLPVKHSNLEFPIMDGIIYPILETGVALFAFDGTYVVICGDRMKPILYSTKTHELTKFEGIPKVHSNITSVSILNQMIAFGSNNGEIILCSISSSPFTYFQFTINKPKPITSIAFLNDENHLLLAEENGRISQISLIHSLASKMIIQTVLINTKSRITTLRSTNSNIISFSCEKAMVSLKIGHSLEVILYASPADHNYPTCSDVFSSGNDSKIAVLFCNKNSATLTQIDHETDEQKENTRSFDFPIARCFLPDSSHVIIVLACGSVVVLDYDLQIIQQEDDLPVDVPLQNIMFCGHSLIIFGLTSFYQRRLF